MNKYSFILFTGSNKVSGNDKKGFENIPSVASSHLSE